MTIKNTITNLHYKLIKFVIGKRAVIANFDIVGCSFHLGGVPWVTIIGVAVYPNLSDRETYSRPTIAPMSEAQAALCLSYDR